MFSFLFARAEQHYSELAFQVLQRDIAAAGAQYQVRSSNLASASCVPLTDMLESEDGSSAALHVAAALFTGIH